MDVYTLKQKIETEPESILIVDVREGDEVEESPLVPSGTLGYVNVPLGVLQMLPKEEIRIFLAERAREGGRDLTRATIIVSCRSGGRSARAQVLLAEVGIAVENLEGGFLAWQAK